MAKALQAPVDDVLNQFRISALTTPIAAIEMSNLDKEMNKILSKQNIPKDLKMKMYYQTLNKFQDARNIFEKTKNVTFSPTVENQEKNKNVEKVENIQVDPPLPPPPPAEDEFDFPYNELNDSQNLSASFHSVTAPSDQDDDDDINEKKTKTLKYKILDNKRKSELREKIKKELRTSGKKKKVEPILNYLLSSSPNTKEPRFGPSKKKDNILTNTVASSLLKSFNNEDLSEYPILNSYKDTVGISRSPFRRGTKKQSGEGKNKFSNLKIHFKKWNKILGL